MAFECTNFANRQGVFPLLSVFLMYCTQDPTRGDNNRSIYVILKWNMARLRRKEQTPKRHHMLSLKSFNFTTANTWVINVNIKSSTCRPPPFVPFAILRKTTHAYNYFHVVQTNIISILFAPTNTTKVVHAHVATLLSHSLSRHYTLVHPDHS